MNIQSQESEREFQFLFFIGKVVENRFFFVSCHLTAKCMYCFDYTRNVGVKACRFYLCSIDG